MFVLWFINGGIFSVLGCININNLRVSCHIRNLCWNQFLGGNDPSKRRWGLKEKNTSKLTCSGTLYNDQALSGHQDQTITKFWQGKKKSLIILQSLLGPQTGTKQDMGAAFAPYIFAKDNVLRNITPWSIFKISGE